MTDGKIHLQGPKRTHSYCGKEGSGLSEHARARYGEHLQQFICAKCSSFRELAVLANTDLGDAEAAESFSAHFWVRIAQQH